MIVAFTGIDGSGKSLQAKSLVDSLSKRGAHSLYVWSRYSPLFLKPVFLLGRVFFGSSENTEDDQYRSFRHSKRQFFRHSIMAQIWQTLVLLDYYMQVLVKIKLRSRPGRVVICDRYVPDFLVDLGVNFGYGEEDIPHFFKSRLLSLFPKPDLTFLLDISEDVAFQRKDDVSLSYLRDRRALYLSFGKLQGMEILDGAASIENLRETIHRRTLEFLDRRRGEGSRKKS